MHIPAIIIGLLIASLACASVDPGLLKHTVRKNDDQRAYVQCMQQDVTFVGSLRAHCLRWSRFRWANWAWEDCMNEGLRECGYRPRWDDVP